MSQYSSNFRQRLQSLWQYKDLLKLLVKKSVKLKYRRSFLGYIWSILNPLLIMLVMTVVFSSMFNKDISNYPVYLICGRLLFDFMKTSTHHSIFSITGNAALFKKRYVPKYLFTLARITSDLVDLVFSLGAMALVIILTHHRLTWYTLFFPFVLLQLYIFCIGLGLFLAQANVFFRDTQFIFNAVTTAWMYLTPIFYPIESLSDKLIWFVKHCNPMYFYIGQFRDLVYYGRMPGHLIILAGCGAAIVMLLVGVWSFMRSKDKFILYI